MVFFFIFETKSKLLFRNFFSLVLPWKFSSNTLYGGRFNANFEVFRDKNNLKKLVVARIVTEVSAPKSAFICLKRKSALFLCFWNFIYKTYIKRIILQIHFIKYV